MLSSTRAGPTLANAYNYSLMSFDIQNLTVSGTVLVVPRGARATRASTRRSWPPRVNTNFNSYGSSSGSSPVAHTSYGAAFAGAWLTWSGTGNPSTGVSACHLQR